MKFKGIAVNERYYNDTSCWGIFNIRTSDHVEYGQKITDNPFGSEDIFNQRIVTVVGNMQHLCLGAEYEFVAVPEYNQKYKSWQYKPSMVTSIAPQSQAQARIFLSFILTEKQADTLLNAYPNIIEEVTNGTDNVDLSKLKGIGEKTWAKIRDKIVDNFVISDLITMLQPHGVSYGAIMKMLQSESNPSLLKQKILENPYYLTQIRGFGFKKVDDIALKLKPEIRASSKRAYAFTKYYLTSQGDSDGHTWVLIDQLRNEALENINESIGYFDAMLTTEAESGVFLHVDGDKVGLRYYYDTEKSIFDILQHLNDTAFLKSVTKDHISSGIQQTESEQGFEFTDEQREVIKGAFNQNVTILSGPAGSGKTSLARAILNIYRNANCSIAACSLSAKAAVRITEATGFRASTIHMLLGTEGNFGSFKRNAASPLFENVVFLDESSMVNASLLHSLLMAIAPGSRIIMCGDHLQLPPIGFGNPFSDLLQLKDTFQSFELKTVHRQAAKSGILTDANKIRAGEFPIAEPSIKAVSGENKDMIYAFRDDRENMQELSVRRFLSAVEKDGIDNVVLVVPRRMNCLNSTDELNAMIQDRMFAKSVPSIRHGYDVFKLGARIIQIENNYEKNVMNGEMGYIIDLDDRAPADEECISVRYKNIDGTDKYVGYLKKELDQISLAYALTVHKTQGSQWDDVVAVIDNTHYALLDSCLLYTAITRAKKKCMLIAEPNAFQRCVTKNKNIARKTWLEFIAKECA